MKIFTTSTRPVKSVLLILLFTCIILVQSVVPVKAQNYKEGFVITQSRDTLYGLINFNDKKIYRECIFKASDNAEKTTYHPGDIKAFRILEGKYYQSSSLTIGDKPTDIFLEYIIKGKASIFYFRDSRDHYFIEKENGVIVELTQEETIVNTENGKFELPNRHRSKLKAVLSDCPEIFLEIEKVSLNHKSLTKLAEDYHYRVCDSEDCIVFERKETKIKLKYSAVLGAGAHTLKLGSELTSESGVSPMIGLNVEIHDFLPWSEKLSIVSGLYYQKFGTYIFHIKYREIIRFADDGVEYFYHNSKFADDQKEQLEAQLDMITLKIPLMLKYEFGKTKVSPYLGLGLLNMFVISQNENFQYHFFSDVFGKTVPFYHIGLGALAGVNFYINEQHAFRLEANYEYTSNLNVNKSLKLKISQIAFKAGYTF